MRIFIGFTQAQLEVAQDLGTSLRAHGHEVMVDAEDYPPAPTASERQRAAVEWADRFIFLVSPESIARGSNALAALSVARRKWPNPKHGVMAVMAQPVQELPEYLHQSNVFDPPGALVPEVVNAIYYSRRARGGRLAWIAAAVAGVALVIVGAVYLGFSPGRGQVPDGGGPAAAQFEMRGSPDFLNWGGEGVYELVSTLPSAASKYRCEITWEKGRNIESLEYDEECKEIRVRAVNRPFVDASGERYKEGEYDPEAEGVALTVIDADGKELWRTLVPVGLMNAGIVLTVSGAGVSSMSIPGMDNIPGMSKLLLTPGVPAEVTIGTAAGPLAADYKCTMVEDFLAQNVKVASEPGSCRMSFLWNDGRLPSVVSIAVTHEKSQWKGQVVLRTTSEEREARRRRRSESDAGDRSGGGAGSHPAAGALAQLTRFCGGQLFCQVDLRALKTGVREVRLGTDPANLDYRIPGSLLGSAPGGASRIFFPAAARTVYVGVELEDGGVIDAQRVEITNERALKAVPLKRNRGADSVRAWWLAGNEYYLLTQTPIVRAWYDVDGRGFLEAQVTGDRNLVTLPTAARDFLRFRLQLASGERLDGLEFAIDRGRVTGELAARAESVFIEDGSMDCRYERGHAGRGVVPHVLCTPVLSEHELDWVGVKEIRYGTDMNRLDQTVTTSLDPKALSSPAWQKAASVCQKPPGCFAEFRLPGATTDVYVQYVYRERASGDVLRIVVDDTWRQFPPEGTPGRTTKQLMEENRTADLMMVRQNSLETARRIAYNRQERASRK